MASNQRIGILVREARKKAALSQFQLAQMLGITQATVSRLERDQTVSREILRNALEIVKSITGQQVDLRVYSPQVAGPPSNREIVGTATKGVWTISTFRFSPYLASGDVISSTDIGNHKFSLLIADTVGSGEKAAGMGIALEYAFNALRYSLPPAFYNVEGVRTALEGAYKKTRLQWDGPPSALIVEVEKSGKTVAIMNCGMPAPVYFSRKAPNQGSLVTQQPPLGALGADSNSESAKARVIDTVPGDAFLFCSDGFKDTFESLMDEKLGDRFIEAAETLVGDSKGILMNLVESKSGGKSLAQAATDDLAAVVLSRKRDK